MTAKNMSESVLPWLSVIIPSYNGERWIADSLGSIAAEGDHGIEVILVDSSASPITCDIAENYSSRLRLRIIRRPDLASWQEKTNFGVGEARAEHLCWLGVDDVWLPGRAAAARAWIAANPQVSLHLAPCAILGVNGGKLGVWRCPLQPDAETPSRQVIERLLLQNFISAPAPVFLKNAWLSCGGLDESLWYSADWDVWLKLANFGRTFYHRAVTVGFRIHNTSLTSIGSTDPKDFASQMQLVLDRHLAKVERSDDLRRPAEASIAVNVALASAAAGDFRRLGSALAHVLRLGPIGIFRYMRYSRIMERVIPRLRAKWKGEL